MADQNQTRMTHYLQGHQWHLITDSCLMLMVLDTLANPDTFYVEMVGWYHVKNFGHVVMLTTIDGMPAYSSMIAVLATDLGRLIDVFPVLPSQEQNITVFGLRTSRWY